MSGLPASDAHSSNRGAARPRATLTFPDGERESQGIERMEQIKYAVLERNGGISIIPKQKGGSFSTWVVEDIGCGNGSCSETAQGEYILRKMSLTS